jgi:hypothetical protein
VDVETAKSQLTEAMPKTGLLIMNDSTIEREDPGGTAISYDLCVHAGLGFFSDRGVTAREIGLSMTQVKSQFSRGGDGQQRLICGETAKNKVARPTSSSSPRQGSQ